MSQKDVLGGSGEGQTPGWASADGAAHGNGRNQTTKMEEKRSVAPPELYRGLEVKAPVPVMGILLPLLRWRRKEKKNF